MNTYVYTYIYICIYIYIYTFNPNPKPTHIIGMVYHAQNAAKDMMNDPNVEHMCEYMLLIDKVCTYVFSIYIYTYIYIY
jgi:hypothetical protein